MDDLQQVGATRLIPPAILPPERDPSQLVQMFRWFKNPVSAFPKALYEADAYQLPGLGTPLFVMHPTAVKAVLQNDADFPHGHSFRRVIRPVWGKGLLGAEPESWRAQRHAAAGAFRPADMAAFAPAFARAAQDTVGRWASSPGTVDMAAEMSRITFDIILETMLSGGEGFKEGAALAQMKAMGMAIARMRPSYFIMPDAYHAGRFEPETREGRALTADILAMVRRRRSEPARGDLLNLMMQAGFDDVLLTDNIKGFMAAGHDTTALALTWALYLVAIHPPTAARIRAEADAVIGDGPLGPDQAQRLTFTRQVISEALRLYPPGYVLSRVAQKNGELAGRRVKAGQTVGIPIYAIHRHRKLWADPDVFDPDRFAPAAPQPDRYSYLPFGAGPHICLGAVFAMIEAAVILATLVRAVDVEPVPGHAVRLTSGVVLRPEGGMPLRVRARQG